MDFSYYMSAMFRCYVDTHFRWNY